MATVNNAINLGFQVQAPASADQSGAGTSTSALSAGDSKVFANLLMQQMNGAAAGLSSLDQNDPTSAEPMGGLFNFGEPGMAGLDLARLDPQNAAGTNGLTNLLPLLSALKAQFNSKSAFSGSPLEVKPAAGANQDSSPSSALAVWLASISSQQLQPNTQNPITGQNNLSGGSLLNGPGISDPRVMQAIEQVLSRLQQGVAGQAPNKTPIASPAIAVPTPQQGVGQAPSKTPIASPAIAVPTPADNAAPEVYSTRPFLAGKAAGDAQSEPNNFAAVIQSVSEQAAGGDQHDSKLASTAGTKQDINVGVQPAGGPANQDVLPATQPVAGTNSSPQGQTSSQPQSDSGHSGSGDSRKSSTNQDQFQSIPGQGAASNADAMHPDESKMAAVMQTATHNAAGNGNASPDASSTSSTPSTHEIGSAGQLDSPTPRVVNAAQLMQAAGQAEMHVAFKSETAGAVDIRAMLDGNHISATIAAQHTSTRDWLMANVSDLHNTLSRDDLHLRTFEVTDSSLQSDPRSSGSGQQDAHKQEQPLRPQYRTEFQQAAGLDDLDLNQNETASQALSLHA